MTGDESTPLSKLLLLVLLAIIGGFFLIRPTAITMGVFVDWLSAFPDPSTIGPYGNIIALVALLLGGGGLSRKFYRNYR